MNSKTLSKRRDQMRHKTNSFVQTSRNSCLWELSRTERFPTPELFLFKPFSHQVTLYDTMTSSHPCGHK